MTKPHNKTKGDIIATINKFRSGLSVTKREASYDFCYGYFQTNKHNLSSHMEDSCMRLWSYLASWGMLRGSSELLQKSPAALKGLIIYLDNCPDDIWNLDVDTYSCRYKLLEDTYKGIYAELKKVINHPSCTLVTKIMLGVFGNIPAFDTYFTNTFRDEFKDDTNCGFRTVNKKAILDIATFYETNYSIFDSITIPVIDFDGKVTQLVYKKAKLIDMYGFSH